MANYRPVRALERGLAVLRATNTLPKSTVEAVAAETGLSWSTTLRMLETLERSGYVRRNSDNRAFYPTVMSRALGEGTGRDSWVAEFASKRIGKLSRQLVWPIDLMIFSNDGMLIVETTHRSSPLSLDRNMVGRRMPVLLTSAGRAYLAHTSPSERAGIVHRLRKKQDDEGKLARNRTKLTGLLASVRTQGYGVRESGLFPHTKSISVPIITDGRVQACISIIWIASALTMAEGAAQFVCPIKRVAAAIAKDIASAGIV